jgi:aryl-alcohol dehydrogenase-like predicted oxidoreductase
MKIGLGTAQLGFNYGISNAWGKPDLDEVTRILAVARDCGIQVLDTAHSYGDSESVLGECLPTSHDFRIVTKTLPLGIERVTAVQAERVREAFTLSLERLRQPRVYALLVHQARDLLAADAGRLIDVMDGLKAQGQIQKFGVSIYDESEMKAVLERHSIDIVQLPFNVFDQRLLESGTLARLRALDIEVHARSVFLQGLLLMEPGSLAGYFESAREPLTRLRAIACKHGRTVLETALRFAADRPEIDCAVIGIARHQELDEIVAACRAQAVDEDYSGLALHDESILNPARWPH